MDNNLSESQISEFKQAFSLFDKNGRGSITSKDLESVMKTLGQKVSQEQLKTMIKQFDKDQDGAIDFEQFLLLMQKKVSQTDPRQQMKQAFNLLDRKGTGFLTMNDFKEIMWLFGQKLTQNKEQLQLKQLFDEADINADGKISFEDFQKVMSNR